MSLFSERLRTLRKEKKLTQVELAQRVGAIQGTLTRWESGKLEPDLNKLVSLALELEVSADYLLGKTDEKGQEGLKLANKSKEDLIRSALSVLAGLPQRQAEENLTNDRVAHIKESTEDIIIAIATGNAVITKENGQFVFNIWKGEDEEQETQN